MYKKFILLIITCLFLNKSEGMNTTQDVQFLLDVVSAKINNNVDFLQPFHRRIYSKKLDACHDDFLTNKESNDYISDQLNELKMALDDVLNLPYRSYEKEKTSVENT